MKKTTLITFMFFLSTLACAHWTNGTDIYNTNAGNVTIGNPTPYTVNAAAGLFPSSTPKLEVVTGYAGSAPFADLFTIRHPGVTSDVISRQMGIVLKLSTESSAVESDKMGGMLLESANIYANYPTMSLVTANLRRLTIDQNGNIGINTTDTKYYRLAVNGSMIANSVTVKAYPWADYVFKSEYRLRPLAEVKAYIDRNQHLPEIPSAQEVAANGVNLGEMNTLLLKKVEELTLYLIEMK
ncbi:hypothetical protein [Mucilaginibacter sp. FT3.2]|uniref:hypothetical protein n=1 Tax=Mucilaginibacter sp. FT3.2 TaxID=2723090 RepID=UPI00160BD19B|nr:hypothetical protein [Mucilaginibacter sp. FT3.2]MBB6235275.1 hypothetical protein [Mucilaginibacter sp. FT3.2]